MLDMKQPTADNTLQIMATPDRAEQFNVLLVEPAVLGIADRPITLLERDYRVTIAKDARNLWIDVDEPLNVQSTASPVDRPAATGGFVSDSPTSKER